MENDDTKKAQATHVNGIALINGGKPPEPGFVEGAVRALNDIGKSEQQIIQETMKKMVDDMFKDRKIRPARYWESIICLTNEQGHGCKVYRRVSAEAYDEVDVEMKLLMSKIPAWASMQMVFDYLSTIDGVTRIELTQANGDGVVKHLE